VDFVAFQCRILPTIPLSLPPTMERLPPPFPSPSSLPVQGNGIILVSEGRKRESKRSFPYGTGRRCVLLVAPDLPYKHTTATSPQLGLNHASMRSCYVLLDSPTGCCDLLLALFVRYFPPPLPLLTTGLD